MDFLSLLFLACALSTDAFAVAFCKGFTAKSHIKHYLIIGLYFGLFQAIMPTIGFFIGTELMHFIGKIDHWIAFILLSLVGLKMIKESFEKRDCPKDSAQFDFKTMIILAIATSIDALAVGVSFAFLAIKLWFAVLVIGVTTFILSIFGLYLGINWCKKGKFGTKVASMAEAIGGVILIAIGVKILIQHIFE